MNRRSVVILVTSHFLLLLAGGMIAEWQSVRGDGSGVLPGGSSSMRQGKALQEEERETPDKGYYPTREWKGSEYARAWKAVRSGNYTTRERIRLQRNLLRKWADVELVAAIEAALGEAWDRDGDPALDPCGPLLDVFSEALAANPQVGWDMIRGRQFGVGTGMLRRVWMEAAGVMDPLFLAARLADLSWRDREHALEICHRAVQGERADGVTEADLFKVFAGFPQDMVSAEQLLQFATVQDAGAVDLAEMKEEIIRLGSDDRMSKVKAMLLGKELASRPPDEISTEIEGLPDGAREEVVWAAFKDAGKLENVLGLVDLLIEENAWGKVEQVETVQQLQKMARDGGSEEVAEWATSLPLRKETIELFHRSVETFLGENLDAARAWLAALPPGVWRDRAHAEFSQVALNSYNNTRASRWALDRIGDGEFKAEAESWRAQWEKRTGWASQ